MCMFLYLLSLEQQCYYNSCNLIGGTIAVTKQRSFLNEEMAPTVVAFFVTCLLTEPSQTIVLSAIDLDKEGNQVIYQTILILQSNC